MHGFCIEFIVGFFNQLLVVEVVPGIDIRSGRVVLVLGSE